MATLSQDAARALVGKIRENNGGISPQDRKICPPAVLRALESVRKKLGAATKTLATNLYSKDTRFVYELIQNAEDNKYTKADEDNIDPYLSFSMYPDRIILDSNEDGFYEEHVRAICSTGESTKTVTQGYIGKKGIGFKSVFKIAKKVHIQSGPFSFSFEHTKDSSDDGLGMVTPLDEDYDDLPEGVRTRIILTLLDPSSFDQRAQDLLNIPDTLLLFLIKLNTLYINIYPQSGSATEIEYSHFRYDFDKSEAIRKTTTVNTQSKETTRNFYVTRREINNLPHDEARKHTKQATVVLAFPVDEDDEPIIHQQHVFAFLPLRRAGFTFLIQSDFITQASREDVFHSTRNEYLLSGVAETFRDAVIQFCDHSSLRYQWMRYLPSDSISDEFWKTLRPKIISLLSNTRCLRSWSEVSLYLPRQLYRVTNDFRDRNGEPLFADLAEEIYLSQYYTTRDFASLSPLGTRKLKAPLIVPRIQSDLGRANSKMKSIATDEDWHTRTAKLLSTLITTHTHVVEELKSLDLIPLKDEKWVSARTSPIFFPHTGVVPIPTDLGLNLVQPAAVVNAARKTLFSHLGVKTAVSSDIISLINTRYCSSSMCTISENISHLRYLYWSLPREKSALESNIYLMDQNGKRVDSASKYIYFEEEEEEYGPRQLLQSTSLKKSHVPDLAVHFLNMEYLNAGLAEVSNHGRSWKTWLAEVCGVKTYPQLQNPTLFELSDEFKYIIKYRPKKVVGLLKRYWSFYETQLIPLVVENLKRCRVPSGLNWPICLENTFLPLPKLKTMVERLKIEQFPFLEMPQKLTDEDEDEWQFLNRFGVRSSGGSDDLHFYVEALRRISVENIYECTLGSLEALFEVYGAIEQYCSSSDDAAYICRSFANEELIYIPSGEGKDAEWFNSTDCVWTAPEWLETKRRLDGVLKYASCKHLFRIILKIGDADWRDYIEDLKVLKYDTPGKTERVMDIYRRLWREFEHDSSWDTIRTLFETTKLIFLPSKNTWHPLSTCIWADDQVRIPRKVPVRTPYSSLEDFFCRVLNVPKPNLEMHVQALEELARSRPPPSTLDVKQAIMLISSMEPTIDDVKSLRKSNIFSVVKTNGQKTFTNITADFAIVDRSEYGSAFAGKIRILDYSIEEVRACRSLFLALDLKRRHLSELVEETTKVRDGAMNAELTQSFRSKAYALFRCAVHYHSQRRRDEDKSLYDQLLVASIYVSDGISKSISIVQYGETVTVENSRANFHLDEENDELRLYVPRDESAREECFFRQLPRRLMTYLAISDPTAEALLNGIIGCRSLIAVDGILKDAGIVKIVGIERPSGLGQGACQSGYEDASHQEGTVASTDNQVSQFSYSTLVSAREMIHIEHNELDHSVNASPKTPSFDEQSSVASIPSPSSPEEAVFPMPFGVNEIHEKGYASLLERVINIAERMTIPTRGSYSNGNLQATLPIEHVLLDSVFATRSAERDRKVGAAGELLIFEILFNLGLFEFTRNNWKSTIRTEVRIHNKYRNLEPWVGRETADITYVDSKSALTKLFIEKGYLQRETWEDERPTYYLEVKTTTRDCSEQFYMSGSQYRRMKKMKLQPNRATSEIYVILRVFNLKGRIGLRVYVDPEYSQRNGELEFSVETWAVRPVDNIQN